MKKKTLKKKSIIAIVIGIIITLLIIVCVQLGLCANHKQVVFFAHRGFSAEMPDNTIVGFELAASEGYGIDCDLRPTAKDLSGEFDIVVSHDNNLLEVAGIDKNVTDMTADEVYAVTITNGSNIDLYPDEHIPSLQEVLKIADKYDSALLVEMKGKDWNQEQCEKLLFCLWEYNVLDRVIVNSLYIKNLELILVCAEKYEKSPNTLYTILNYEDMETKLEAAKKAGVTMVSMRSSIIREYSDTILQAAEQYGFELLTWTSGEEDEKAAADAMRNLGIRYIEVDSRVK